MKIPFDINPEFVRPRSVSKSVDMTPETVVREPENGLYTDKMYSKGVNQDNHNVEMGFDINPEFVTPRSISKSVDMTPKTVVREPENGLYIDKMYSKGVNQDNHNVEMGFDINPEFVTPICKVADENCEKDIKDLSKDQNIDRENYAEKNQHDSYIFNEEKKHVIPFSISQTTAELQKISSCFKNSANQIKHILDKNVERKKVDEKDRQTSINEKVVKNSIKDFFVGDTGGVFRVRKDNTYEEISTYNIEFVSCIKRVEEHEIKMFLKILVQNDSDKLILTVGVNELENIADIIRNQNPIFYLSFVSKNAAAAFRQYVYKKYETVRAYLKIEVEYNCVGWTKDLEGRNIYVSHHLPECISENERKLEIIRNDELNEVLEWGMNFVAIGKNMESILPIWLYSFYGFSIPLLQEAGLQTQMVFMIRGRSGSLKTAVSKVLYSLFEVKNNNVNFQSTKAAVETGLSDAKDNNFLWDDIYDIKHSSTKHFLEIIRCIADNIGRSKMNMRTGKKEQFYYRLGLVVTAENPIGEQMSGRLRYIVCSAEKNSFIGEKLALYQADAEKSLMEGHGNKLEKYYSLFIYFLQNNFPRLKEELRMWVGEFKGAFKERRLNSSYQCFIALAFLVTKFHLTYKHIDSEMFIQMMEMNQKIIFNLIAENEREASIVEDYKLWCQIISDGLASGEVSIAKNCEEYSKGGGTFFGYYFSEQELALEPNKTFAYVKKIAESRYSNAMVISKINIEKKLDEERIIIGYDEKKGDSHRRRRLKRVVIDGLSIRVLMVDLEQLKKTVASLTEEM